MKKSALILFFLSLSGVLNTAHAQNLDEVEIRAESINDSIFVLFGDGGNIGVLIGEDGTLIVDDQFAPLTEKLVTAIAEKTDQPVRFVINTHWHFDHTDGNENFGGAGAIIVSHKNSRIRMETEQFIELFNHRQAGYAKAGLPKITFEETLQFHINGETIDVLYPGSAHTNGDAIVYFRDSNVVHAGDIFVTYGLPFIDQRNGGSINGMIDAVDKIAEITDDNTILIPGHGRLSDRQDLLEYREMLVTVRDNIDKLIRENRTFEEIVETNPAGNYPAEGISAKAFVRLVYDSLVDGNQ
jgi:glyoxylase-like metal-dependent hydrolase (beta-lactamase superfamily II)